MFSFSIQDFLYKKSVLLEKYILTLILNAFILKCLSNNKQIMTDDNQPQAQYTYNGDNGNAGGKPSGKYKGNIFQTAIKIPAHNLSFDENYFLQLIAGSIALRIDEKEKIIDSIPKLSQRQVDELMKIFEEEKDKFDELAAKYPDQIKQLRDKAKNDWKLMETKLEQKKETEVNQNKVDELKNLLKKSDDNSDSLPKAA